MPLSTILSRARRGIPGGRRSVAGAALAALLLAASVSGPATAVDATPLAAEPGPAGDFTWKGFNWEKRSWAGAPHYNRQFAAANVSDPDVNGHVTMTLSNPTGESSIGAEFNTTRHGFGYGTYSTTIEKDLTTLQKEVVWGCLFTYDSAVAPGFNEIDLCEASSWGGGSINDQVWPVTQGHGYWFDAGRPPGEGNDTAVFGVTNHPVLTHRLIWEPDKLTFETFAGEGYSGTLLKRTVKQGDNVPEPARETVHFNLWVTGGGGGDPARVKPEKVVIRDFSFVPAGTGSVVAPPVVTPTPTPTATATPTPAPTATAKPTPTPTRTPAPVPTPTRTPAPVPTPTSAAPSIALTATSTKARSATSTTLAWRGATGSTVTLVANGVRTSIANSGRYTATSKGAPVRYQVCDRTRCSPVVIGSR